jgi:hypothetical protein
MVGADGVTFMNGVGLTVTLAVLVFWQPAAVVPVTVYVVVVVGETVILAPVAEPGSHV